MERPVKKGTTVLFYLSLVYELFWLAAAVVSMFTGVDSGWAAPALSNGSRDYGLDAFFDTLGIGVLVTAVGFWFIPLYQVIWLLGWVFGKLFRRMKRDLREDDGAAEGGGHDAKQC